MNSSMIAGLVDAGIPLLGGIWACYLAYSPTQHAKLSTRPTWAQKTLKICGPIMVFYGLCMAGFVAYRGLNPQSALPENWVRATDDSGTVSVEFPVTPKQSQRVIEGREIHELVASIPDTDWVFRLTYSVIPPQFATLTAREQLEIAYENMRRSTQIGGPDNRKEMDVSGYPGYEYSVTKDQSHVQSRVFIFNGKLYRVTAQTSPPGEGECAVARFFDSCRVQPQVSEDAIFNGNRL